MSNDEGFYAVIVNADSVGVVTAPDGRLVVAFTTPTGPVAYPLSEDLVSGLIERLLTEAGKQASLRTPGPISSEVIARPIPVAQIGIGQHPTDRSSVLLSLRTGGLRLTFQVDLSMWAETLGHLPKMPKPEPKSGKH